MPDDYHKEMLPVLIGEDEDDRSWRIPTVTPTAAFARSPPVLGHPGGRQRVESSLWPKNRDRLETEESTCGNDASREITTHLARQRRRLELNLLRQAQRIVDLDLEIPNPSRQENSIPG
jgi:hypothetical protein